MTLSGVLTADHAEQETEEVDDSDCVGTVTREQTDRASFAFSAKITKRRAFAIPKAGVKLSFLRAQISKAAAARRTVITASVQPTQYGTAEDCNSSYPSGTYDTVCKPNESFPVGLRDAGNGKLQLMNDGEGPDRVFYVDGDETDPRLDCPAELGGFLKEGGVQTALKIRAIRRLDKGKSITASGGVVQQRPYGLTTADFGGNYKLKFKRVK